MAWIGTNISKKAAEKNVAISTLAIDIGVPTATLNSWIKGVMPKGTYILALCNALDTSADFFFSNESDGRIGLPAYRTRKTAKVNPIMNRVSMEYSEDYAQFFKNVHTVAPYNLLSIENIDKDFDTVSKSLREKSSATASLPLNIYSAAKLLQQGGVNVIFRDFDSANKSYAFYTKIYNHQVVFINLDNNLLDLTFAMLHEVIHVVLDENEIILETEKECEDICNDMAGSVQFGESYIKGIYDEIKNIGNSKKLLINKLTKICMENYHAMYGLYREMEKSGFDINIEPELANAVDNKLRGQLPTVKNMLFETDNPIDYVNKLEWLSPIFMDNLVNQIDVISNRKLKEILALESALDAKQVKNVLLTMRDSHQ